MRPLAPGRGGLVALIAMLAVTSVALLGCSSGDDQRAHGAQPPSTMRSVPATPATDPKRAIKAYQESLRDAVQPSLALAGGIGILLEQARSGAVDAGEVARRGTAYEQQAQQAEALASAIEPPTQLDASHTYALGALRLYAAAAHALALAGQVGPTPPRLGLVLRIKLLADRVFDRARARLQIASSGEGRAIVPPAVPDFAADGVGPPDWPRPSPEAARPLEPWQADVTRKGALMVGGAFATPSSSADFVVAANDLAATFADDGLTEAARGLQLALLIRAEAVEASTLIPAGAEPGETLARRLEALATVLWNLSARLARVPPA